MENTKDTGKQEELLKEEKATQETTQQESEADQQEETTPEETAESTLAREKDKFLRLFAEFENYKKRTTRERMDLYKTAGQEVITAMLPVLDDFDRALRELERSEDEELFKGVVLIHNKFRDALVAKGLESIEVEAGDAFDSEVHDAVTQIPAPDTKLKGKIIDVIEKGYKLGDRIIRHPKVVVGN